MSEKTFRIILCIAVLICASLTVMHFVYAFNAYRSCSIIYFIGKELW